LQLTSTQQFRNPGKQKKESLHGDIFITIFWFAMSTCATAGLSYYPDKGELNDWVQEKAASHRFGF